MCRSIRGASFPNSKSESAFSHSSSAGSLSNGVLSIEQPPPPPRQTLATY